MHEFVKLGEVKAIMTIRRHVDKQRLLEEDTEVRPDVRMPVLLPAKDRA